MRLSIFTTLTEPTRRGDAWQEALNCYGELADELIVMDGSIVRQNDIRFNGSHYYHEWPQDFSWTFIGEQFQRAYEACSGDWVIHCDADYIFHEKDFNAIRDALEIYNDAPAVSFYKWQFLLPDRYNLKSRLVIAVNRKKFGKRIKFDGGGDLCQPTLDGKELDLNDIPQAGVPFYNYEKLTKTEAQIRDDVVRMDKAYKLHFGRWLYSSDGTEDSAYQGWLKMMVGRFSKPQAFIQLEDHPKYIRETIKNLTPDQFGYDGLGHLERNKYVA